MTDALPPLPWTDIEAWLEARNAEEVAEDIRSYARAAVEAERERIAVWLRGLDCAHVCGIGEELASALRGNE